MTPTFSSSTTTTRIRTLLKRYLQERGYRVSTAPNAAKALSTLNSLAFDLLVLDVMMPGMNGFELTEAVRQRGDTPILLLTARGEAEDRIKGLTLGADDYLAKPFEPEELVLRINAILRRHGRPERRSARWRSATGISTSGGKASAAMASPCG